MSEFADRVAVVTGAAKGVGRALAETCLAEGMRVVLADLDEVALSETHATLLEMSPRVTAVPTDVSDPASVEALAQAAVELGGEIGLLFNNAGVVASSDLGSLWKATEDDWQRLVNVNLWGVIHGCRSFLPLMMKQNHPSRIVNTASIAGVISAPSISIYSMTKHAVVSLSDSLDQQLEEEGSTVRASVICPGFVRTNLVNELTSTAEGTATMEQNRSWFQESVAEGTEPMELARRVFDGIRHERRYIFTHTGFRGAVVERHERILQDLDAAAANK
ncbi:MAG: SDR family NAD(P)-dependent oxidoreductase [Gemmatimonadetes bacterium]|jgi:NAD(P)-dependent dehydrogenase (short-subunit alcohol dehydrogenase family)|nr:SDR family NAD(P)-dependent oxidoreductase [Gemmatimonadota bacterium]MBT6146937.1 SDR family NAD(P)-dependent oxidoreductase [Gemmatimonadota bacterium]MBT7860851.1 SDR family NAD(P)-dependent oxidoreductase [Gemmatimonadota bacterium]